MKRIIIIFLLLSSSVVYAQEIDSLANEQNPEVEQLAQDTVQTAQELVTDTTEVMTQQNARDTVYIRDTIYVDNPVQTYHVDYQDPPKDEIKTLAGRGGHNGGFGALSFRATDFRGETMVLAGLRGGWIINRSLAIGLEGHGIIPTAKFDDISQFNRVVALGGYGGLFIEPIFFSNTVVHFTIPVSGGAGWLGYHEDWDETNTGTYLVQGDVFWYIEPGINAEVNIARNFRLALGVSKRFVQDLQLINTTDKDFEKINYYMTLKIGSF